MKICLLNDSFPPIIDGVVNVALNYADILSARNNTEVIVGTPWYPDTDYKRYPYPVMTYPSLDTSFLTGGYRAGYPFPIREIGDMIAFKPDIIHTHCPVSSCFIARSMRDACNAPVILTYHTKYDIDIRNTVPSKPLQEECIKALVNNVSACDEVWAVSKGAGESLKALGYAGSYRVMPNGVDFPKGRCTEEEVISATKEYDLPSDVPVFLYVGRIMDYKGLPIIVKALSMLKEDYRMVFIGRGPDMPHLKEMIHAYGIFYDEKTEDGTIASHAGSSKGKIILTGAIHDRNILRAWNTRADLFIFPSTFDTNGLVVREAAACGLASVLIQDSCAAEGITDGRNGFLIEQNADSLSGFLVHACTHMEEIHQAGEKAMEEIYLSWHTAVDMAYRGYEEVLEKKRNGQLPQEKNLFDDPLYEMSAEAARRYVDVIQNQLPQMEGMLENMHQKSIEAIEAFQARREQRLQEIKDFLKTGNF